MSSEEIFKNLEKIGVKGELAKELGKYLDRGFSFETEIPKEIEDEPFIEAWKGVIGFAEEVGVERAMNELLPHGEDDIKLLSPEKVKIQIYSSVAGNIPVIYAREEEDFYELVKKLIHKGRPVENIEKTGASFAFGKTNRFIILSNKPYSNIPAEKLGLDEKQWREFSLVIRREHECAHYFTKRFLGSSKNNILDELVADFIGMYEAAGTFYANWFLVGLGLDEYPKEQPEGRWPVYTGELSKEAKKALKGIAVRAAEGVERWSKGKEAKKLSKQEKILFLCGKNLLELCEV